MVSIVVKLLNINMFENQNEKDTPTSDRLHESNMNNKPGKTRGP